MPNILFADDNKNIREFVRRELEDEGYHVLLARDGAEAVRLTRQEVPDLAILDICMPTMDGLEAAETIGTCWPEVPVIFFTCFDDDCTRDRRSCRAVACVEKRQDLIELKNVVAATLASHRHHRPYRLGLPPAALSAGPAP